MHKNSTPMKMEPSPEPSLAPSAAAQPMRDDDAQWTHSAASCLHCYYRWIAVHPLDADELACPKCMSTDTVREFCDSEGGED